jgi:hypothetical protein
LGKHYLLFTLLNLKPVHGVTDLATKHRQRINNSALSSNPHIVTPIQEGPLKTGYSYDSRAFFSYQEILCYQYLQSIGIPGKKMHMEYRVGRKHYDFFPLKRVFWEHHPILRKIGKDKVTYAEKRRATLDANGYSHIPLVVTDCMFTGVNDIKQKMLEAGVDFRIGSVPSSSIIYLKEIEEMCLELLKEPLMF